MEDNTNKSPHAGVDESNRDNWEQINGITKNSNNSNTTFGSGPSGPIADGGVDGDGKKQPKERTGKDSNMGGADGGTAGMGYLKENIEPKKED